MEHTVTRHHCNGFPCATVTCEHHRTELEVTLTREVHALIAKRLPVGTRARIGGTPFWEVRVGCGGSLPITGYTCCLKAGHEGRCYCESKNVDFTPEAP